MDRVVYPADEKHKQGDMHGHLKAPAPASLGGFGRIRRHSARSRRKQDMIKIDRSDEDAGADDVQPPKKNRDNAIEIHMANATRIGRLKRASAGSAVEIRGIIGGFP